MTVYTVMQTLNPYAVKVRNDNIFRFFFWRGENTTQCISCRRTPKVTHNLGKPNGNYLKMCFGKVKAQRETVQVLHI